MMSLAYGTSLSQQPRPKDSALRRARVSALAHPDGRDFDKSEKFRRFAASCGEFAAIVRAVDALA